MRRSALGRGSNVPTTDPTAVYTNGAGETSDCVLSHDGSVALLAYTDGRVGVVHAADGARGDFTQHASGKAVRQVALSADGRVGASAALDGTVRVFETDTLIQVSLLRQTGYPWANGVALSADGSVLIASFTPRDSDRGKIVRFDWAQRTVTVLWHGFNRVFEVSVNHDASKVLFIRQGGVVSLLDATPGTKPRIVANYDHMKGDLDVAMDTAAERILIVDKQLQLHGRRNNGVMLDNYVDFKPAAVRKIDITADGSRAIEIGKRCVLVRNLSTGAVVLALVHKFRLANCAISADGGTIIAGDVYGSLVLWRPDYLPKTELAARSLDGKLLDLKDIRSVLDNRLSHGVLPIPARKPRVSVDTRPNPENTVPETKRRNTPPTPTCVEKPARQITPLTPPPNVRQPTPPTSPERTHTLPQQHDSSRTANPKLPLPPAIHPKYLTAEYQPKPVTANKVEPLQLQLVSVQGVSVSPSTPSPGLSNDLFGKASVELPKPPPVVTNVETAVQLDADDTRAFTPVESVISFPSGEVTSTEENVETGEEGVQHAQITEVESAAVIEKDHHAGIIPVESAAATGEQDEHFGEITLVESVALVGEHDSHASEIITVQSTAAVRPKGEEEDVDDRYHFEFTTVESSTILPEHESVRHHERQQEDDDEFLRRVEKLRGNSVQQLGARPLTQSSMLRGNMFLQQLNLSQPEEYEAESTTRKSCTRIELAPRIEEYDDGVGTFPAAPSFPVLEPEMSGTCDIFRSVLK